MLSHRMWFSSFAVLLLCLSVAVSGADKKSKEVKADATNRPSYELAQPASENLDYTMYQRIRDEGLAHSHVMEFASGLMDGIGPRLTGSPNVKRANEWTRDQFAAMGCSNAHLEDWGEFVAASGAGGAAQGSAEAGDAGSGGGGGGDEEGRELSGFFR
jgi:carboxypeptidase Q